MSESNQLSPRETSSIDERQSSTQEVSSVDSTDIQTKPEVSAPVINESVSANEDQEEQQVTDESTGEATPTPKTDEGGEAQQYERFEAQMSFDIDTPEAKNEELLKDLVENKSNIGSLDSSEIDSYVVAINSTFSSTMIQGVANRSVRFNRMILVGDSCSVLKPIVKSPNKGWEDFIEDRLGKELLSTIGTYMRLAKIKGVKNHSYLGKDRILKVFSTGKKLKNLPSNSSDPIGDILHQLKIDPINNLFEDVPIFNKRVDAALLAHKIALNGITVNHQSVIDLASTRFNFKDSNKHLKRMCYLRDNTVDSNNACQKYLDNIIENDGTYTGSPLIDESVKSHGEDDFINGIKESYASIRTSFHEGKELSVEEKSEIKILVDYLTTLIA